MWRRRQRAKRSTAAIRNGNESGDQDELDRPAREDAGAEVDVGRGAGSELGARVEPAQELLCARPSCASRTPLSRDGWSGKDAGGRSPPLVRVTVGMPWASIGPCSTRVNGKARSISWPSAPGAPASARLLEHPLRGGLDERPARRARPVPASTSRGGPRPASASRSIAATTCPRCACSANRCAPRPRTRLRRWRRRRGCAAD